MEHIILALLKMKQNHCDFSLYFVEYISSDVVESIKNEVNEQNITIGYLTVSYEKLKYINYDLLCVLFKISKKIIMFKYCGFKIPYHNDIILNTDFKYKEDINDIKLIQNCTFYDNVSCNIEDLQKYIDTGFVKKLRYIGDINGLQRIEKLSYFECYNVSNRNLDRLIDIAVFKNPDIKYHIHIEFNNYFTIDLSKLELLNPNIVKLSVSLSVYRSLKPFIEYIDGCENNFKLTLCAISKNSDFKELKAVLANKYNIQISKNSNIFTKLAIEKKKLLEKSRFARIKRAQ